MNNWNLLLTLWLLFSFTDYCTNLVWTEVRQEATYRFRKVLPSHKINTVGPQTIERDNTLIWDQCSRANLSYSVCTRWVRPRPWCHTLSQRRTGVGDKQKNRKQFHLFFSRKQCFYRNNFRMSNSTRTSTQKGEKKKKYLMALKGSQKSKMAPLNDDWVSLCFCSLSADPLGGAHLWGV